MQSDLRDSGIPEVGEVPWGAHFCHFYETKDDLLDILVPFFRTGLQDHELCVWLVFDPLTVDEVRKVIARDLPGGERHLQAADIEIVPYKDWHGPQSRVDITRLKSFWEGKLTRSRHAMYDGLRANGGELLRSSVEWNELVRYDQQLTQTIQGERIIIVCTSPLSQISASQVFEYAQSHEFVIARRFGHFEKLESPELKKHRQAYDSLSEQLESQVLERTLALSSANEHLRALCARLQMAKEQESARIAREIHDQMGSALTSLRWRLETLEQDLDAASAATAASKLRNKIAAVRDQADELAGSVKRIASQLRPSALDVQGLGEAMKAEAAAFAERTGIEVDCVCDFSARLSENEATALFRISQEALTNVQEHARATHVTIALKQQPQAIVLTIADNGRGINEAEKAARTSLGIWSMRERAHLIGARFEIRGSPRHGTEVKVTLPLLQRLGGE